MLSIQLYWKDIENSDGLQSANNYFKFSAIICSHFVFEPL